MNKDLIYKIRENKTLYMYLKYNSYLYKRIIRNEISIKELESMMKKDLKLTTTDKLSNISSKIEMANAFLNLLN